MASSVDTPSVQEFRALMRRVPAQGDQCSCGATFEAGRWTVMTWTPPHRCYPRIPAALAEAVEPATTVEHVDTTIAP